MKHLSIICFLLLILLNFDVSAQEIQFKNGRFLIGDQNVKISNLDIHIRDSAVNLGTYHQLMTRKNQETFGVSLY